MCLLLRLSGRKVYTSMSNVDEAKRIIEEMRAKREALGDTTNTTKKIRYKRSRRTSLATFVLYLYIFVGGMLTSALLMGFNAAIIPLFIIMIVAIYSYLRE